MQKLGEWKVVAFVFAAAFLTKAKAMLLKLNRKAVAVAGIVTHFLGFVTTASAIEQVRVIVHSLGGEMKAVLVGAGLQMLGLLLAYYGKPHTIGGK